MKKLFFLFVLLLFGCQAKQHSSQLNNQETINKSTLNSLMLSIPDSSKVINKDLLLFNRRKDWQTSLPFYFDNTTFGRGGLGLDGSFILKVPLTVSGDELRLGKEKDDMTDRARYSKVFPSNGDYFYTKFGSNKWMVGAIWHYFSKYLTSLLSAIFNN